MLYMVNIRFLELKDQRLELFTSLDEAVSFAKYFIRKDLKNEATLEEEGQKDGTGLYYTGRDGKRLFITVYRKFVDCEWRD